MCYHRGTRIKEGIAEEATFELVLEGWIGVCQAKNGEKMFRAGVAVCMHTGSDAELGVSGDTEWSSDPAYHVRCLMFACCLMFTSSLSSWEGGGAMSLGPWERDYGFPPSTSEKSPFWGWRGEWKAGEEMPGGTAHVGVDPSLNAGGGGGGNSINGHSLRFPWSEQGWRQGERSPGGHLAQKQTT